MKSFYRISVFSLLLLVCNMVGAQEITLDFTSNEGWNFPTEETKTEGSFTKDGVTIKLSVPSNTTKGYSFDTYKNESYLFPGTGGYIYFPQFDFDVEKFEVQVPTIATRTGLSVYLERGDKEQNYVILKARGKVTTVNVSDELKTATGQYAMKFNKGAQLANIKVYKTTSTAIKEMNATKADDSVYYTLDGMKVNNPTKKGIYIKNGKKVVL